MSLVKVADIFLTSSLALDLKYLLKPAVKIPTPIWVLRNFLGSESRASFFPTE